MKILYEFDRCVLRSKYANTYVLFSDEYVINAHDYLLRNAKIFEDNDFIIIKAKRKTIFDYNFDAHYSRTEETHLKPFNKKSKISNVYDFELNFKKFPFIKPIKVFEYSGYWINQNTEDFCLKISKNNISFLGKFICEEISNEI